MLRRLLSPIIATYASVCILWIGFADGVAPNIIANAYNEQSLSVLNWVFQGHRSLPIGHYFDRWSEITTAVLIATILHLVIVLSIIGSDHKYLLVLGTSSKPDTRTNFVLIVFSAAFLALTALSPTWGDYNLYVSQWKTVLEGRDPWLFDNINSSAYGPLFNLLSPLAWINPRANKLFFAFAYLAYLIWLVKDFAPRRGIVVLSWPLSCLWLLNPFPWLAIACLGYFDVLVALACVAAVHNLIGRKDGISGTCLALGILLKYMPIVILPFLVFGERRLHFRLFIVCVGVVIFGLIMSVLVWGTSTFLPIAHATTGHSYWSIYEVLAALRPDYVDPFVWLEKPLLVTFGLGMFVWCVLCRSRPAISAVLAISVTLLFYRIGYIHYQMVPFVLIVYWVFSEWQQLVERPTLVTLLGGYFGLLAILDFPINWWEENSPMGVLFYRCILMFKFLLGCALLAGLVHFSSLRAVTIADQDTLRSPQTKSKSKLFSESSRNAVG